MCGKLKFKSEFVDFSVARKCKSLQKASFPLRALKLAIDNDIELIYPPDSLPALIGSSYAKIKKGFYPTQEVIHLAQFGINGVFFLAELLIHMEPAKSAQIEIGRASCRERV